MSVQQNDDFDLLNNFAHDMKTPLGALKSFLELVENSGPVSDTQQHYLERAMSNVERIERMISDLLEYARLQSLGLVHLEQCDLQDLLQECVQSSMDFAALQQVTIHTQFDSEQRTIQAHRGLLKSIFTNLLTNSIKYNRENGTVWVRLRMKSGAFVVEVADTGKGISPEVHDRIFDRFFRDESNGKGSVEGTGLGLAIVKHAVEKLGGYVRLHSVPDQGSTFTVTLPGDAASLEAETAAMPPTKFQPPYYAHPDAEREVLDDMDDDYQEEIEDVSDKDS